MQRIISLLLFQSTENQPLYLIFPWIDRRFPEPIEAVLARIEGQEHRRCLKSHLPLDGLPLYDEVRYIHVARSGLDICMSYHNHCANFRTEALAALDREGLADETIGRPYPRAPADPASFYRLWITQGVVPGHDDGLPTVSFFELERTYWEERHRPNLLFVHYNDLQADLAGEMRRIAEFLELSVPLGLWPKFLAAARFEAMRRDGEALLGNLGALFEGGAKRFFFAGTNERWRGVLTDDDISLYGAKVKAKLPPACAEWLAHGRLASFDPRSIA